MCWISSEVIPRIAEEDIEIFKMCEGVEANEVESYYRLCFYTLNHVYKLISPIVVELREDILPNKFAINKGFHSYIKECTIRTSSIYKSAEILYNGICVDTYNDYAIKVKGYIPKGTKYYINNNGECVSEAICLTEICT